MARFDYFGLEQAIAEQLQQSPELAGIRIEIEREPSFFEGDQVFIYMDRRQGEGIQTLSAGTRQRWYLYLSIWCFSTALETPEASRKRDELLSKVELALMRERTFGNRARSSWMEGGQFDNPNMGGSGFTSGASITLVVDVSMSN